MAKKTSIGATIYLGGEKEYRQAISKINTEQKLFAAELKKTAAEFSGNEKGLKSLKAQTNIAADAVEKQKEKVRTLKGAVEEATKKYGENSTQVTKWKTSLANAETELAKMEKGFKDLKEASSGLKGATNGLKSVEEKFKEINSLGKIGKIKDDTKEFAKELKNVVKETPGLKQVSTVLKNIGSAAASVAKVSFKATAAGVAAAGAGILKIGKDSISAYADMEQLRGGVETLFKGAANDVIRNANNAFKTAGMSANEYMENVTSFSASLIQSVGGDTKKAAKIADQAIVDMSDNANKMGTDISSIQNAYQGFAKGNYTMLDNLKLGYGGTKEEMERLLADAEKLTGKKFDLSNFADITQAIHAIQTEIGISGITAAEAAEAVRTGAMTEEEAFQAMGTTAKEATSTIQGSISSVKSAYQNLLAGLSDENADLEQLLDNFVDSIFTAGDNLIPRAKVFLKNTAGAIKDYAPKLVGELVDGIVDSLDPLLDAAFAVVDSLVVSLLDPTNLEKITTSSVNLVLKLVDGLINNLDPLIDGAFTIVTSLADALLEDDNLTKLIGAAVDFTVTITTGLLDHIPDLIHAGFQLVGGLVKGLWDNRETIWKAIKDIGKQLIKTALDVFKIQSPSQVFKDMGLNIIKGLINGLDNAKQWVYDKIHNIGRSIITTAERVLEINSPSKVFKRLGDFTGQGYGIGFVDRMKTVRKDIEKALPTDLKSTIGVKLQNVTAKAVNFASDMLTPAQQGGNKTFNFNVTVNIDGKTAENSNLDELAEQIGEKLFKQFKKRTEAFA